MYSNVIAAAQATINGWAAVVRLLAAPNSDTTAVAEKLAPFYLPTYTSITLGSVTPLNRSAIRVGAVAQFDKAREIGLGTDVQLLYSRIEPVSNESALVWATLYLCPPPESNVECWAYTEPFGFRLSEDAGDGLSGGWEFGIGDNEFQSACARFTSYSDHC